MNPGRDLLTASGSVHYDHHSAGFVTGHQRIHAGLRARCPVAYSETYGGFWVLSRYDDVFAASHENATFSSAGDQLLPPTDVERLLPIQVDPPLTQRYRGLISPYLTPRAIAAAEPAIQEDIDDAIGRILERGHSELVSEACNPIPARATMRLLGLDPGGWSVFGDPLHESTFAKPGSREQLAALERIRAFTAIIEAEVDARYACPKGDLITDLTTSVHDGGTTTRQEVIDLVRMLIFGGMDTVMGALSNIFAILAVRADLRRELAANPAGIGRAIEEFLRFEAPIQGFARYVTADTQVAGHDIRKGERVWLGFGSANHDEAVFDNPGQLDLARRPNRHVTFGVGAHRCQGSTLARTEMRMVLQSFLAAIPDFSLTGAGIVQPDTIGQILGKREVHIRVGQ